MKIESKKCAWHCGHKSTQRGNIARDWRYSHKHARTIWKRVIYKHNYEALVKRI